MMKKSIILFLLLCSLTRSIGQKVDAVPECSSGILKTMANITEWGIDLITIEKENSTFFFLPVVGYEERTGLSIGLLPSWRFYLGGKEEGEGYFRPSSISVSSEFSTTGMYEFYLSTKFYTKKNWYIQTKWVLQQMPDRFYTLGNSSDKTYYSEIEENKIAFTGRLLKIINKKWFVGLNYDMAYFDVNNVEGDIFNMSIAGYGKDWIAGMGPSFTYDNRNNVVYPKSGVFIESSFLHYFPQVGAYDFSSFKLDARTYIDLGKKDQVLAFQAMIKATNGEVPFYRLSALGGKRAFRGISRPYKYLEDNSAYAQMAYRRMMWWRIGCEVFTGVGNAFDRFDAALFDNLHVMAGAGLRLRVLENEKLSFRIDYGATNRGDSGVFFTLGEAF